MPWILFLFLFLISCDRLAGRWNNPYDETGANYHAPHLQMDTVLDTVALGEPLPFTAWVGDSNSAQLRVYWEVPAQDSLVINESEVLSSALRVDTVLGVAPSLGLYRAGFWVKDEKGIASSVIHKDYWVVDSFPGVVLLDKILALGEQYQLDGLPQGATSLSAHCSAGELDSTLLYTAPSSEDTVRCDLYYQLNKRRYHSVQEIRVYSTAPLVELVHGPQILSAVQVQWKAGLYADSFSLSVGQLGQDVRTEVVKGQSVHLNALQLNRDSWLRVCAYGPKAQIACADTIKFQTENPRAMSLISAGNFNQGSLSGDSDESPVHVSALSAFWMDQNELSWSERQSLVPTDRQVLDGNLSANYLSWSDAVLLANARSKKYYLDTAYTYEWCGPNMCQVRENQKVQSFRLPSESEWEYAARAGTESTWFWGEDSALASQYALYSLLELGSAEGLRANAWGLKSMVGGLWEWTSSDYLPYAGSSLVLDSVERISKSIRGGSWREDVYALRSSNRQHALIDQRSDHLGVRFIYR